MSLSKRSYWSKNASHFDKQSSKASDIILEKIKSDIGNSYRILDIGAGTGKVSFSLAYHVQYIDALDAEQKMIEIAKEKAKNKSIKNISFHIASAYQLPFSDTLFDAVVILNTLHIIKTPKVAVIEAKRVLKENGLLIVPTYCHAETEKSLNNYQIWSAKSGHKSYHLFTLDKLCELIESCNFSIRTKSIVKVNFGSIGKMYMGYVVGN